MTATLPSTPPRTVRPAGSGREVELAPDVRVTVLRPVVSLLPAAATSLYTLLSVGPQARQPMFEHVAQDSARLDLACTTVMSQLLRIPEYQRPVAVRLAQSSALLGRLMLAVARVAAQGNVDRLPASCPDCARAVVGITERVAAVDLCDVPAPRSRRPGRLSLTEGLQELGEASNQLDQLMWQLTATRRSRRPGAR